MQEKSYRQILKAFNKLNWISDLRVAKVFVNASDMVTSNSSTKYKQASSLIKDGNRYYFPYISKYKKDETSS